MPQTSHTFTLDITPERYLNACSLTELYEIQMLLDSKIMQHERQAESELIRPGQTTAPYRPTLGSLPFPKDINDGY